MANAVKLINGGTIQVRTGVLAGIGPMGPRGPIGLKGETGLQGPVGDQGIQGQILQIGARSYTTGTQNLPPNVWTTMAFGSVSYDDMGVFTSSANMTFLDPGDYQIAAYVVMAAGTGAGRRSLRLNSTAQGMVWANSTQATANNEVSLELHCNYRVQAAGEGMQLHAWSTDTAALLVNSGVLTVTRIGSGPVGPEGPQGLPGVQGIQGVQGAKGDPGNGGAGFATYGAIDAGLPN